MKSMLKSKCVLTPMKSIKSRYASNTNNYLTLSVSGNSSTKHHMLSNEEFKAGKQGYVFTPYIVVETTTSIELPSYMIAEMKRDSLRKKLQKIKK